MMGKTIEREPVRTNQFKRDYKRELKTHGADLNAMFFEVLEFLISDTPLPFKYKDHKLTGNWEGFRSCHIKPDLVVNYAKPDDETLLLARIGSHTEIYGL